MKSISVIYVARNLGQLYKDPKKYHRPNTQKHKAANNIAFVLFNVFFNKPAVKYPAYKDNR